MDSLLAPIMITLLCVIVFMIIRNRKVPAPTMPGEPGASYDPTTHYYDSKRDDFLNWLHARTSSPEIPVQVKLRDWVDQGFYAEDSGNYWGIAQQFTYYLLEGGYARLRHGGERTDLPTCADRPAGYAAADPQRIPAPHRPLNFLSPYCSAMRSIRGDQSAKVAYS